MALTADDSLYMIETIGPLYLDDSSEYVVEIEARPLSYNFPHGKTLGPQQKTFHFLFPNRNEAQSLFSDLLRKIQQQNTGNL